MTHRIRLIALAAAAALYAAHAAADAKWDQVVKAAIAEGEVDVHGGPGRLYNEVLTEGFAKAYPQIKVNFSGLSGRDAIPKILNERQAGIYSWDVYVGGSSSVLQNLKPTGAIAPIKPYLMLPEVLDDKAWFGGLDGGFMDAEGKYLLGFQAEVTPTVMVNWDFVKHEDLKTYPDLLKPQFAGKIVWDDPRLPGAGSASAARLLVNFGADFLRKLLSQQKIVAIGNMRQNAEWVVRGTYPIGLGTGVEDLKPFQEQGLGKNISELAAPLAHPGLATGFGTITMLTHPPHPNAAKVYVNWLLSKAGQMEWQRTGYDSRRVDIPHVDPDAFPKPGVVYIADEAEVNIKNRVEAENIAKQAIGTK